MIHKSATLNVAHCDQWREIFFCVTEYLFCAITSASSLSVFKNTPKEYLLRRCYETVLTLSDISHSSYFHFLFFPLNNSFNCLGHFKHVCHDDDDDDDDDYVLHKCNTPVI